MGRLEKIEAAVVRKAVPQVLRIKTLMDEGKTVRRQQERDLNRYISDVGVQLQRLVEQGSKARKLYEKFVEEFPGRNVGSVLSHRQRAWVKEAKNVSEIMEFAEYIGGPDRKEGSALYVVRDVVSNQKLLRDAKESVEKMARTWFKEKFGEEKDVSVELEKGGYPADFRQFLPPDISFEVGPTRELLSIVEIFGREKKNWNTMMKKLEFIVLKFNDIVRRIKQDMKSGDEAVRLQALMMAITIETGLRPGAVGNKANVRNSETGEKEEVDTFGITTLHPSDVKFIRDNFAELNFVGKKGTQQVATLTDAEVLKALKEAVDSTTLDGGTDMIFITKSGEHVDDDMLRKYCRDIWGEITPTDFRKLRATQQFYDSLKKRLDGMREQFRSVVETGKVELKEMVVEKVMAVLKEALGEAQVVLNHKDVETTIETYVDPRVVVNFLNQGGLDDTLEDILVNNKNVRVVFDFEAFVERARRVA